MKISIVIPLFNKQDSIKRAINSVLHQVEVNPDDIEIIVVDDGSSDNSSAEVEQVIETQKGRSISLIKQENAGVSSARNRGVKHAKSLYVAFLDADDTYEPTFLSEIDKLISRFPTSALFCTSYNFVYEEDHNVKAAKVANLSSKKECHILPDFFLVAATGDLPFCASSICVRRSIFWEVGGFPIGENMGEDQSLYCQIALRHDIAYSPAPHANYYCCTSGSLMQTHEVASEMPYSKRIQTLLDQGHIHSQKEPSVKKYIAGHLLDLVRRNLYSGNTQAAQRHLNDARSKARPLKWLYWTFRVKVRG